jgi:hypothetical protein
MNQEKSQWVLLTYHQGEIRTFVCLIYLLLSSFSLTSQIYTYDFSIENQYFEGGISDYYAAEENKIQYEIEYKALPIPWMPISYAQYISSRNTTGDLFMYIKREINGLKPNTRYMVNFMVEFATKYRTNEITGGGSAGDGVIKAGITGTEPKSFHNEDLCSLGHIGLTDTTTVWALTSTDNFNHPFTFTTGPDGSGWLIVGTESSCMCLTEIYFTKVFVDFTESRNDANEMVAENITISPDPSTGSVHINSGESKMNMIRIRDMEGNTQRSYLINKNDISVNLPKSDYIFKIQSGESTVMKRVTME